MALATIPTRRIPAGTVVTADIGADAVTNAKVADEAIGPENLDHSTKCVFFEDFLGRSLNETDSHWVNTIVGAGPPTGAIKADAVNGEWAATLESTSEAQLTSLYWNDELNIDIDTNPIVEFRVTAPTFAANTYAVFGLAGAYNATLDSIAQHAWFRFEGADQSILLESDDGTNDNDDKDSTVDFTAAATWEFQIDFSDTADVLFNYRTTLGGTWTNLTDGATTFDMSNYTGNLQPFIAMGKSTGASAIELLVDYVKIRWDRQ